MTSIQLFNNLPLKRKIGRIITEPNLLFLNFNNSFFKKFLSKPINIFLELLILFSLEIFFVKKFISNLAL